MKLDGHAKLTNAAILSFSVNCAKATEILQKDTMCRLPQFSTLNIDWKDWMNSNEKDNSNLAYYLAVQEASIIGESMHPLQRGYLTRETVAVDIEPLKLPLHVLASGQKYHFMRDKSDKTVKNAYNKASAFVHANAQRWVEKMHYVLYQHRPQGRSGHSTIAQRRDAASCLALALHSLQDSFSPAHTRRASYKTPNQPGAIEDMYIYSEQDHNKHSAHDYESGSRQSLHAQSAVLASADLMKLCVASVSRKSKTLSGWNSYREKWIKLSPKAA
ncbi:MAG: hypothetical protein L0Z73_16225 [Gammaproteobacteria bacterium]|nr:hypothetical protein [Gammaproteobacteria bacterium]